MIAHGARPKFMAGRSRFRYAPTAVIQLTRSTSRKRTLARRAAYCLWQADVSGVEDRDRTVMADQHRVRITQDDCPKFQSSRI